jgi:hypothetical protein
MVPATETVLTDTTIVPDYAKISVLNFLKILQCTFADNRGEPDGYDFDEIYSSKELSQNLRKVTIIFVMSVFPFGPHGTTRLPLDGFS